jgi:hypothetical protein
MMKLLSYFASKFIFYLLKLGTKSTDDFMFTSNTLLLAL